MTTDLSVQTNVRKLIEELSILLTSKTISHLLEFSMPEAHKQRLVLMYERCKNISLMHLFIPDFLK